MSQKNSVHVDHLLVDLETPTILSKDQIHKCVKTHFLVMSSSTQGVKPICKVLLALN